MSERCEHGVWDKAGGLCPECSKPVAAPDARKSLISLLRLHQELGAPEYRCTCGVERAFRLPGWHDEHLADMILIMFGHSEEK